MQENIQEKSPIKQKILQYLSIKGVTAYEFYKKTGVTRGILQQNNGISEDNIARFLAYATDINIEWLMTGVGEMLRSGGSTPEETHESVVQEPISAYKASPAADYAPLFQLIEKKDAKIEELSKEIGRLEEVIRQLTVEKAKHVSDVSTERIAGVG